MLDREDVGWKLVCEEIGQKFILSVIQVKHIEQQTVNVPVDACFSANFWNLQWGQRVVTIDAVFQEKMFQHCKETRFENKFRCVVLASRVGESLSRRVVGWGHIGFCQNCFGRLKVVWQGDWEEFGDVVVCEDRLLMSLPLLVTIF